MLERKATLVVNPEPSDFCRRFRHSQPVGDVLDITNVAEHPYLIVVDRADTILGIVETEELLKKLASPDPVERRRWSEMPMEAAISARLDSYESAQQSSDETTTAAAHQNGRAEQECSMTATALSTGRDDLAAIFVEQELYLRWSSVKGILQHALVDPVTSLPNRMVFERRLEEEWQRLERSRNHLSVVLIDLDYFKSINDRFGHAAGDAVLNSLGQTLRRHLRSYDLIVRYGGDEFAALLSGCDAGQLEIPLRRVQNAIANLHIEDHPGLPPLTLSVGAASIRSQSDIPNTEDLLHQADSCLYAAKRDGRNCAFIADLTSSQPTPRRLQRAADEALRETLPI